MNPPSREEIQKEFEEFVQKKFGPNVKVVSETHFQDPTTPFQHEKIENEIIDDDEKSEDENFDVHFDFKPRDIKEYLDRFVIKQDDAKKALAIAVCDHYNHVRSRKTSDFDYAKQNVLLLGPTGVGKTYLVKQIAKLIGVPFVKADATRFSETGYVGSNVDDLIHDLVNQAGGNIELAQYGIIYLDEADKLAAGGTSKGKDVSGRGVQFGLLKLMEETEVDLRSGNDMRSQMQAFMEFQQKGKLEPRIINTKNILFIISGAFTGMTDITKQRLNRNAIGFGVSKASHDDEDYLKLVTTDDLIEFGFEPEFVGRLPIKVSCEHLTEKDLFDILENSEGSIIKQYKYAFKAYGIDVSFTKEALLAIASMAEKEKTGARALMTTCEKVLRNYKYELPSTELTHLEISKEIVNKPKTELEKILKKHKVVKVHKKAHIVKQYADDFFQNHGLKLVFDNAAINKICEKEDVYANCEDLFQGYEHGLKLIHQNTEQDVFKIDLSIIKDPKTSLENWIKKSYS